MTDVAKLQIQVDSEPALKAAQNLAALDSAAKRVVAQAKNLKQAQLGKSATTGGATFKNLTKPVDQAATAIEQYVTKLTTTSSNIGSLKTELAQVAGDFGKITEAIGKIKGIGKEDSGFKDLTDQLKPLGVELRSIVRPLKANAKFFKAIKDNTKGLTKRIGSIATKFETLRGATAFSARNLRRVNDAADTAATSFDKLRTNVGQTTSEVNRLEGEAKQATAATKKFQRSVSGAGISSLRASNFVRQLATGLGLVSGGFAIAQGARAFVSALADFEFQAAKTSAVAVKLSNDLADVGRNQRALIDQSRELGASTRFTAVEAAEAQFFLARAGFDVKEVLDATPATLNLAAAGYLDLGRAADIASNALQQFQLETSQLGDVTDALVFTANNANTSVEQLAQALNYAGPFAASLGVTVNEAAGAIGALGNAGIQGSLAGTNFRGILVSLLSPSREAGEELDKLGKRLEDFGDRRAFDVTKLGIEQVVINLRRATEASGDASAEFAKIFNRRNVSGALALTRNVESLSDLLSGLDDDLGAAERVRKFVDDTLIGALQRARSAATELSLAIGEGGVGTGLRNFVDDFAKALRVLSGGEAALANLTDRSLKFAQTIKGVTSALGALIAAGAAFAGARFGVLFLASLASGTKKLLTFRTELSLTNLQFGIANLRAKGFADGLSALGRQVVALTTKLTTLTVTNPAFAFAVAGAAALAYSTNLFGLFNKSVEAAEGQRELADATRAAKKELELFVSQDARIDNLSERLGRIGGLLVADDPSRPSIITEVTELVKGIEQVGVEAAAGELDSLASSVDRIFEAGGEIGSKQGAARRGLELLAEDLRATGSEGEAVAERLEKAFEKSSRLLNEGRTASFQLDTGAEVDRLLSLNAQSRAFNPAQNEQLFTKLLADLTTAARRSGVAITEEFNEQAVTLVRGVVGIGEDAGKRIQSELTDLERQVTTIQTRGGQRVAVRTLSEFGSELGAISRAFKLLNQDIQETDLFSRLDPSKVAAGFDPLLSSLEEAEAFLKEQQANETLSQQEQLRRAELLAAINEKRREQLAVLKEEEVIRKRLAGKEGPALEAEKRRIELLKEIAEVEGRPLILEFDKEAFGQSLQSLGKEVFLDVKLGESGASTLEKIIQRTRDAIAQATPQQITAEAERLILEKRILEENEKRQEVLAKERQNVDAIVNRLSARKRENELNLDTLRAQVEFEKSIADAKDRQALIDAQILRETDKLDFSKQFGEDGKLIDNENLVRARELLDPLLKDLDLQRQEQRGLKLVTDTSGDVASLREELVQLELIKDANADLTAEELARRQLSLANVSEEVNGYQTIFDALVSLITQRREYNELIRQSEVDNLLDSLREENRILVLRINNGGELTAQQEAEAKAKEANISLTEKELQNYANQIQRNRDLAKVLKEVTDEQERLNDARSKDFSEFIRGYSEQTEATLIQAGVVRDLTVEEEALRIARDNNFSADTLPRIQAEVAARRNATEALKDFNEKVRVAQAEQRALDQAQNKLSSSLADVIVNAKDAEEAFKGFVKQIIAAIAQAKIFALLGKSGLFDKDGLFGAPILEGVNTSVSKVQVEDEFRQAATEDFQATRLVTEKVVNPAPLNVSRLVTEEVVQSPGTLRAEAAREKARAQKEALLRAQEGPFEVAPVEVPADLGPLAVPPLAPIPVDLEVDRTSFEQLGGALDRVDFGTLGAPSLPPVPVDLEVDPTSFEQLGGALDGVDFGVLFPEDRANEFVNTLDAQVANLGIEVPVKPTVPVGGFPEAIQDISLAAQSPDLEFLKDFRSEDFPPIKLPTELELPDVEKFFPIEAPVIPTTPAQLDDGVGGLLPTDDPVIAARLALTDRAELDLADELGELEALAPEIKLTPTLDKDEYLNNLFELTGGELGRPLELDPGSLPSAGGDVAQDLGGAALGGVDGAATATALTTAATTAATTLTTGASTAAATLTTSTSGVSAAITGAATGAGTALTTGATSAATALTGGGAGAAAAIVQGATTAAAILSKASAATSAAGAAGGGGGFLSLFLSAFGFGSYKGNVFTDGTIDRQYYRGGLPFLDELPDIGSQPARFLGMDGSVNSLREGGSQEAILPLGRDGQGRLGVRMIGDAGSRTNSSVTTNNTTVQNFNLQAPSDTFGMSTRQRERKAARFNRRG